MQNRNTFFSRTKCGAYKGAKVGLLGSLGLTIPFSFIVMDSDFRSKYSLILLALIAGGATGLAVGASAGAALGATKAVVGTIRKRL